MKLNVFLSYFSEMMVYPKRRFFLQQAEAVCCMFISAVKFCILTLGLTPFQSHPQVATRLTAVFTLASFFSTACCPRGHSAVCMAIMDTR